ncbi:MAG: hypothetical protein ACRDNI_10875 [Gaiellaceae bacterium]
MPWSRVVVTAIVAGLMAAACSGGEGEGAGTTTRPATTSTESEFAASSRALPPADFSAEADGLVVVLNWAPPPRDARADRYSLYRDGVPHRSLPGSFTTFTDRDGVRPGESYSYEIASHVGESVSTRASATAEIPVPPLRAARLQGDSTSASGR